MGKKMSRIPFLFKPTHPPSSSSSNSTWPWAAACGSPKTLSFRADKIMNSVYIADTRFSDPSDSDLAGSIGVVELVEDDDDDSGGPESIENVIRGLKSDRLFFEAGESSSCMLTTNNKPREYIPVEEGNVEDDDNGEGNTRVMEMESSDPFADFKKSMEEMVDAHGLRDNWVGLQKLLALYLKVNGKSNHGYVVGAFVDLLVALHFISSTTTSPCSSIASSSCCGGGGGGGGGAAVRDIDPCSATAVTDQSPVSGLSFSSNYSSTSNSTTTTPYYSLSSLEEESATAADGNDDDEDNDSTIS